MIFSTPSNRMRGGFATVASALLLAVTLSECTLTTKALGSPSVAPKPTSSVVAPAPKAGDTLTDKQAIALRISLPTNGDWVYKLSDGTNIMLNAHQPLPEVVKADAGARIIAATLVSQASGDSTGEAVAQARKIVIGSLGKPVVLVDRIYTFLPPSYEHEGWIWVPGYPMTGDPAHYYFPTAEAAAAAASKYIAGQPNAADWEVVVAR